jgi:hypothetical protein
MEKEAELVSALLPRAASAGLASGFASRAKQLQPAKLGWTVGFLTSIGFLMYFAFQIVGLDLVDTDDLWRHVLHRMPLAAPFVWLGWFSAVQYGNALRMQEDYAFKEATCKAFIGYRDHMEHLASVDAEEGHSAMNLLAGETIRILAQEPLRILQRSHKDVSPTQGLLDGLLKHRKAERTRVEAE